MKAYQKVTLMPKDTNGHGTIFGGVIMSYIDLAAAACCHDHFANSGFTTVVVRELTFHQPVYVGDLLTLSGEVIAQGTTSVTIGIRAEVQRCKGHEVVKVTGAELVFVAVDEGGKKTPLIPWG